MAQLSLQPTNIPLGRASSVLEDSVQHQFTELLSVDSVSTKMWLLHQKMWKEEGGIRLLTIIWI
jgi:hypothetical protein